MTDLPEDWETGDTLDADDFNDHAIHINDNAELDVAQQAAINLKLNRSLTPAFKLYATEDQSGVAVDVMIDYANAAQDWKIAQRHAGGRLSIGNAVDEDDAVTKLQARIKTGTCATAAATLAKAVTLDAPWAAYTPQPGDVLAITFTSGVGVSGPTLAINGGAATAMYGAGGATTSANTVVSSLATMPMYYDGSRLIYMGPNVGALTANTTAEIDAGTSTSNRTITAVIAAYIRSNQVANTQTGTTYTLVLADAGKRITLNNAAAIALTVPLNSAVAFPVGTTIDLAQLGAGQVTVGQTAGVTVNARVGKKLTGQFADGQLYKYATDTWLLTGDLAA